MCVWCVCVCVCVLVTQSCPTPCDPMHCSPPGSSVHGILQARILEWVAISFSNVNFIFLLLLLLFRILTLFLFLFFLLYNIGFAIHQTFSSSSMVAKLCLTPVTPQTVACQAPLSMGPPRTLEWLAISFSKIRTKFLYSENLSVSFLSLSLSLPIYNKYNKRNIFSK